MEDDGIQRMAYPSPSPSPENGNGNGKRKRGRPRKYPVKVIEPTPSPSLEDANGDDKRKRGRPPGQPNPHAGRKPLLKTLIKSVVEGEHRNMLKARSRQITDNIINEEMRLAFSDIRLIPGCPDNIPDEIAYAIQSFEVEEKVIRAIKGEDGQDLQLVRRRTKFTLWPKSGALERLSRQLGLYEKDNSQKPGEQRPQINLFLEGGNANIMVQGQELLPRPSSEANGYGEGE